MIFHSHRPSQEDTKSKFRSNFKAKIITDAEHVLPFQKISGRLLLETKQPVKHKGIHVQFEGLCCLRYSTRIDGRPSLHQSMACILGDNENKKCVLSPELFLPNDTSTISPGIQTFPFSLEIPGDLDLPAPFKNKFGSLSYRLVVYVKSADRFFADVGEKVLEFDGYLNLLNNPSTLEPVRVEQSLKKSMINRGKLVEVDLFLEYSGYVIGEDIPFSLTVKNRKCFHLEMVVQLVENVKYDATGKSEGMKRLSSIVSQKENDFPDKEAEFTWVDFLPLGDNLKPSFSSKASFTLTYSFQFKVKVADHGIVKGETMIIIGTTRDSFETLQTSGNRDLSVRPCLKARSTSSASLGTTLTIPPAYSSLSSRRGSLETLHPDDQDLEPTKEDLQVTPETESPSEDLAMESAMEELELDEE